MINLITALQDDAMSNMFQILFPEGIPGGGDGINLTLRMDQQLDKPERVYGLYKIEYQGFGMEKTAYKEDTDKKFTLSFRVDSNWRVYRDLENWHKLAFNEAESSGAPEAGTRVSIIYQHLGPNRVITQQIKFIGCKLFSLKATTFDNASSDPVRAEAQFIYALEERDI